MNIVWFEKAPKGRGNAAGDKALKITFTDKPKGVRCNVALTRRLLLSTYPNVFNILGRG
ncbi:MAG: hypothetical protein DDT37_01319 [Firmicutes bacterium]|nr:hypothetical protein [candidate division NPL-UPA2 bacterium]